MNGPATADFWEDLMTGIVIGAATVVLFVVVVAGLT